VADKQQEPAVSLPDDIAGLGTTLAAVRTNCHISDAWHAADYSLCVYLLKMREYFRWEKNIPLNEALPQQDLSDWLNQREHYWKSLADRQFVPVPVDGVSHDPFDSEAINAALNPAGYVYSSGFGRNMKPVFFLGALERQYSHNDRILLAAGREYARELSAPPAMSQGRTIYIRRESLRRMLWEKIEEWQWNRPDNAMQRAIHCYDFEHAPEQSLDEMTENEIRTVMLHETGEMQAGELLGEQWETLLAAIPGSKAEIMVRAVRDNLADTLSTLPGLLQQADEASLHFYVANMSNMRKAIFPGVISAYDAWVQTGSVQELEQLSGTAAHHWQRLAGKILGLFGEYGKNCQPALITLIEQNTL
jgi:hypothetical protein